MNHRRSGCPINLTLETLGDRWSLIVLRDIMFGRHRSFRALLANSIEGIASNILADRLNASPPTACSHATPIHATSRRQSIA